MIASSKWVVTLVGLATQIACSSARLDAPATSFVYDDLDSFAQSIAAIDAGADPALEMQRYTRTASPAFQFFANRFGVTADSMLREVNRRPRYYHYLAALKPEIQAREPELRTAIGRLLASAPEGSTPAPLYFMVANQTAGGQPGVIDTPDGPRSFVAVAIDVMAMSPRVDMWEFPNGGGARRLLTDIPYVVVHETSHVFQRELQGLDNYVAMYRDPARGTYLAYAIREGCADYLTWLASGWQLSDRQAYVTAHRQELWSAFHQIMHERVDDASGWFGPPSSSHPDWPPQVGYGLGMVICRTFHKTAADPRAALRTIYGAYLPEQFDAIVAPFAARMADAH